MQVVRVPDECRGAGVRVRVGVGVRVARLPDECCAAWEEEEAEEDEGGEEEAVGSALEWLAAHVRRARERLEAQHDRRRLGRVPG